MNGRQRVSSFINHPLIIGFNATGGIRTHTVRILRPAPPAVGLPWRFVEAEAAGVEPARLREEPPGFRDRSPRQWGQSFRGLVRLLSA